jgi:hypothetical protein
MLSMRRISKPKIRSFAKKEVGERWSSPRCIEFALVSKYSLQIGEHVLMMMALILHPFFVVE